MQRAFSEGAYRLWRGSYTPFTNTLLVLMVAIFLAEWARLPQVGWLTCDLPQDWRQPWRIWTHPLVPGGILGLLFNGLILWWGGGSLERSWGSRTFAIFLGALCLVAALAVTGMAVLFNIETAAPVGIFAGALVAWCALNPDETIYLYGIIPLKARFLAVGTCLILFFSYGNGNPLVGLMALSAPGFAVLWVLQGWAYRVGANTGFNVNLPNPNFARPNLRLIPNRSTRPKDDRFTIRDLNPLEFFAKRRRRKQFERLMKDD